MCFELSKVTKDVGIINFRDLGGYKSENGKKVKSNCFYRSSPIVFKNDECRENYKKLGINAILDFRGIDEAKNRPDEILNSEYYHICAIDDQQFKGSLDVFELLKNNEIDALYSYMERIYTIIPFNNPAYQKMFDLMLEGKSIVFHCSAGKDRTGFAAYLILKTLGVSEEVAIEDYLLSNDYLGNNNKTLAASFGHDELAKDLFFVSRKNLMFSINAINNRYNSFDSYLYNEYGLDKTKINKLREMYLDD